MEERTAQQVYAELNSIKETLQKLEQALERLTTLVASEGHLEPRDYMSIVGLGASGVGDVSEQHDRYVGKAIGDEHLR